MSSNDLTVFTKPWKDVSLESLGRAMKSLSVQGVELPVRPGYQVEPANIASGLPEAVKILGDQGIKIGSVAGTVDEATIGAMGECGIQILRICVGIDMSAGYMATEDKLREEWDLLIPALDAAGVNIGVQNHCDNMVGSAIGIMHLIEKYDPKHVSAVYDPAHCGLDGEPAVMGLDICWSHLSLVNLKSAYRQRTNGYDEPEAVHQVIWSTCRHSLFSWSKLVTDLKTRDYSGDICLPAEYTSFEEGKPSGIKMGDSCVDDLKVDIAYLRQLMG